MKLTPKDKLATGLVAVAAAVYLAYVVFDGIPLVRDPKGMAAVGLLLGFASRRIGGRAGFPDERLAFVGGIGSMALGVATLVTGSEVVLVAFVASMVALWAAAMYVRSHDRDAANGPAGALR